MIKKYFAVILIILSSFTAFSNIVTYSSNINTYYYSAIFEDEYIFAAGSGFVTLLDSKDFSIKSSLAIDGYHHKIIKISDYYLTAGGFNGLNIFSVKDEKISHVKTLDIEGNCLYVQDFDQTRFFIANVIDRVGYLTLAEIVEGEVTFVSTQKMVEGPITSMAVADNLLYVTGAFGFGSYLKSYDLVDSSLYEVSQIRTRDRVEDFCIDGDVIYLANTNAGISFVSNKRGILNLEYSYSKHKNVRYIMAYDKDLYIYDTIQGLIKLTEKKARSFREKRLDSSPGYVNGLFLYGGSGFFLEAEKGIFKVF